ncbi:MULTISPECIES: hypothetical protein [Cyanophyceae]|uniref:hypothetical protein n=1 Tax=Cyanophyceae TaxID=3028117 RepID=UPI001685AD9B|nr:MULTISPECIES: hypothetical protein [Cyanophyceae]MBD1915110.1 hypothetical protein [Phormidium sp. FACHB-77]MBD2029778.1 hypothetical protein [Phormidium sp. FACHB-322]MBD2050470.1 hypothetical protein [Leptolyngbya sp. FACHB-60]
MAQETGFIRGAPRGIEAGIITAILAVANWLTATAYEQNNLHRFESNLNVPMLSLDITIKAQL